MPRNLLDITHLAKMNSARRILILLCLLPILCLGGCSSINSHLAAGMADGIPQWAGGLPEDAPPRPGTAKYEEMMKERERERQTPKKDDATTQSSNSDAIGAIH
jgi:hypothetical protein